jgi:hypothetical protein
MTGMTQSELVLGVFALGMLLSVWFTRYLNLRQLPRSLCEGIGMSEDGIPCPSCIRKRATGAH